MSVLADSFRQLFVACFLQAVCSENAAAMLMSEGLAGTAQKVARIQLVALESLFHLSNW